MKIQQARKQAGPPSTGADDKEPKIIRLQNALTFCLRTAETNVAFRDAFGA